MKILSNGAPHSLFWYIGHHTKAVYKCTISRHVKSWKYGPYGGTYTNIAKTASASLYFHCYNPISYSGHPRGSKKYRLAKMWGGGVHEGHIWPTAYVCFGINGPITAQLSNGPWQRSGIAWSHLLIPFTFPYIHWPITESEKSTYII